MKILVLHTLPPISCGGRRWPEEFDLKDGAEHVASALPQAEVAGVQGEVGEILRLIETRNPDVIFNMCEAPLGDPGLEPHAAALFEWRGVSFTGARSETLALCRRKPRINAVLAARGVPVPRAAGFPAIVKPADEDGSAGIHADSVCEDADAVQRARARWAGPTLVEEFVAGREFAVSLWGDRAADYVSIGETLFRNGLRLNTYAAKWDTESSEFADSPLEYRTVIDTELREAIVATARGAWEGCAARGYLRVDIRCNAENMPVVLDVNPNPAIGPGVGMCRAVEEAGWTWKRFIELQIESAVRATPLT